MFNQTHHYIDLQQRVPDTDQYQYTNFGMVSINITDYSMLNGIAKSTLSLAMVSDILKSSGTLIGIETGLSMGNCSIIGTMNCYSVMSMEQASFGNSSQPQTIRRITLRKIDDVEVMADYYIRKDNIDNADNFSMQIRVMLVRGIPILLCTIWLFDKLKKNTNYSTKDYGDLLTISFNIINFIFYDCFITDVHSENLMAGFVCASCLTLSCNLVASTVSDYIFQQMFPINDNNKNIHNSLQYYSLPQFNFSSRLYNDYLPFLNRYLFCSIYSNLATYVDICKKYRTVEISNKINDSNYEIKNYIFLNDIEILESGDYLKKYISYDSLIPMIANISNMDDGEEFDNDQKNIYDRFIVDANNLILYGNSVKEMADSVRCKGRYKFGLARTGSYATYTLPSFNISDQSSLAQTGSGLYDGTKGLFNNEKDDRLARSMVGAYIGGNGQAVNSMYNTFLSRPPGCKHPETFSQTVHLDYIQELFKDGKINMVIQDLCDPLKFDISSIGKGDIDLNKIEDANEIAYLTGTTGECQAYNDIAGRKQIAKILATYCKSWEIRSNNQHVF